MTETDTTHVSTGPTQNSGLEPQSTGYSTQVKPEPKPDPVAKAPPKVDHLAEIEQLVRNLHNVSPSGAETIRDQILERIGAIRDPKAWDERMAAKKKVEDDAEVVRKKAREDAKAAAKAEKAAQ